MRRGYQLARAWLIAITATAGGALSHLLAGGQLPHPLLLALACSLTALLTLGLSCLKLPRISLALGVGLGQGLLHLLYSQGQPLSLTLNHQQHHQSPSEALEALRAASLTSATLGEQAASASGLVAKSHLLEHGLAHEGPAMWLGHSLVALLTFALLAYGEGLLLALRALLGYLRSWLAPLKPGLTLPAPSLPVPASLGPLLSWLPSSSQAPRGPPVPALV